MSSTCKIVKIISLASLAFGLICLVAAVLIAAGFAPAVALVGATASSTVMESALMAVRGALCFVAGVVGARGANRPSKLAPFTYLAVALLVLSLVCIATAFASVRASAIWGDLIMAVAAVVALVLATRARSEAEL